MNASPAHSKGDGNGSNGNNRTNRSEKSSQTLSLHSSVVSST